MRNTTFNMNINGVEYKVWNGTRGDNVEAMNVETGVRLIVKGNGTYANKSGCRRAILNHIADFEAIAEVEANEEAMTEDEMVTRAEYEAEMKAEAEFEQSVEFENNMAEVETEEEPEITEEEVVNTINDVIFRNLPKYVQKAIDYCDYVDGVYRIHVNTEFGSKEITENKWADASKNVKRFCKTGAMA